MVGGGFLFVLRRVRALPFLLGGCAAHALFVFVAKQHASLEGVVLTCFIAVGLVLIVRRPRRAN